MSNNPAIKKVKVIAATNSRAIEFLFTGNSFI